MESAVGARTVTFVLSQFLEIGTQPYLPTFENAKSGDFLPVNSIAEKFRLSDLTPVSTALII